MELTDELIDHLADLARLEFSTDEKEGIRRDLQKMISFVEKLGELDTSGTPPVLHMTENVNRLREDQVLASISQAEALRNAPLTDGIYFKVPKVIKDPSE